MLVIGIDPGTAITGYGIVREDDAGKLVAVDYGVITTPAGMQMPARLTIIYEELSAIIKKHKPSTSAVEKIFFSKNVKTAMSVGQARGVVLLSLDQAGIEIANYSPNEIKQAVTGYGGADKRQIQEMVKILLELDEIPKPDDAADALAVAICHLQYAKFQQIIEDEGSR
jgi:crossover junction endodeoxyribonuclease RuvC